jgi:osmotically-inducible protein OsmY
MLSSRAVRGVWHVDNDLRVQLQGSDRRTDADTGAAVMDALIADPGLHSAYLDVSARAGTVTLRGVVETPEFRARAAELAYETPGVSEVHNRLELVS